MATKTIDQILDDTKGKIPEDFLENATGQGEKVWSREEIETRLAKLKAEREDPPAGPYLLKGVRPCRGKCSSGAVPAGKRLLAWPSKPRERIPSRCKLGGRPPTTAN